MHRSTSRSAPPGGAVALLVSLAMGVAGCGLADRGDEAAEPDLGASLADHADGELSDGAQAGAAVLALDPVAAEEVGLACGEPTATDRLEPGEPAALPDVTGGGLLCLGPAYLRGRVFETAVLAHVGGDVDQVDVDLTIAAHRPFNDLAAVCFATDPVCPSGRLAIVDGDRIVSAPLIQAPSFERDELAVTGLFGDEREAIRDALVGDDIELRPVLGDAPITESQ